jgi:hypothetical protein
MARKSKPINGSRPGKDRPSQLDAPALMQVVEGQRQAIRHAMEIVRSNAELLHELYRFEMDEADLGYCCDVVWTILRGIVASLQPLGRMTKAGSDGLDRTALANALDEQRQWLFRAQAVARLTGLTLKTYDFREDEDADLGAIFDSIDETLENAATILEPMSLGLPDSPAAAMERKVDLG